MEKGQMKIIYISHVDWDWIKQRPQFLAEELSGKCQLTYVYKKVIGHRSANFNERCSKIRYKSVYLLPLTRFKFMRKLNDWIFNKTVKLILQNEKTDIVWTADCHCTDILSAECKVIYEAMDLYAELVEDEQEKETICKNERMLVENANHIIVTSGYIKNKIMEMYSVDENRITIIRNGYSSKIQNIEHTHEKSKPSIIKLAYFGTIAKWFDWEMIVKSIKRFENIEYHLIGPVELRPNYDLPNDKVKFYGAVPHSELSCLVKDIDILIMPFQVNEIIRAVDPVKLYEYIAFSKDIICVKYPEIERFSEFVYFYNTLDEFCNSIEMISKSKNKKYTKEQAQTFMANNSWEKRAEEALSVMEKVL